MSDVTNITLKRLQEEFSIMAGAHLQLKTFFYGDFLNTVSSKKVKYCSLLMNTSDGVLDANYINFRLELACMDKTFNDDVNRTDVESDTLSILQDIFGVITMSKRWQSFSKVAGSAPVRKFVHKGEDVVTGWSMSLNLQVKRKNGICNIPIEDYDYQGDYTQYCAGVRIYQDNILINVTPSGGRYDITGGGGSSTGIITNSDLTFNASFDTANNPYVLPDQEIDVYDGDIFIETVTVPGMSDFEIIINN